MILNGQAVPFHRAGQCIQLLLHLGQSVPQQIRTAQAYQTWEPLLPGRNAVVASDDIQYLAEVMISLMQMAGGMSAADALSQWTGNAKAVVEQAISTIHLN